MAESNSRIRSELAQHQLLPRQMPVLHSCFRSHCSCFPISIAVLCYCVYGAARSCAGRVATAVSRLASVDLAVCSLLLLLRSPLDPVSIHVSLLFLLPFAWCEGTVCQISGSASGAAGVSEPSGSASGAVVTASPPIGQMCRARTCAAPPASPYTMRSPRRRAETNQTSRRSVTAHTSRLACVCHSDRSLSVFRTNERLPSH